MSHEDTTAQPAVRKTAAVDELSALVVFDKEPRTHLLNQRLTIGRGAEADLRFDDHLMSRLHVALTPSTAGVLIQDLGSRNGVRLNGMPLQRETLIRDGVLRIGDTVIIIYRTTEPEYQTTRDTLVGGASLAAARRVAALIAPTELSVLIVGETGTGKDVLARWIHARSGRAGAFVAVNCAAIPESLAEAELFGHTKGAFTGAADASRGLFRSAEGGTIFLDEVGELPLPAQAKLLRVLEDHMVRPVGATGPAGTIDFRVIAATNVRLAPAIAEARFRSDLYARLAAVELELPPLRLRREDLPALTHHYMQELGISDLAPDAKEALACYGWPRNVRELENSLRRAVLLAKQAPIDLKHLPEALTNSPADTAQPGQMPSLVSELTQPKAKAGPVSKVSLTEALTTNRGNVRRAAISLGISRSHIYRLLEQWKIQPEDFR